MSGQLAVVVLAVAVGATAQAVTGIGLGLVSGAVLAAALGRQTAVPLLSLLSLPTLLTVLVRNRAGVRWRYVALLVVPGAVLTPVWAHLLALVDPVLVARVSGLCVVASAVVLGCRVRVRALGGVVGSLMASALSSLLNVAAGVGSPPTALYAVNARWSPTETRGTLQVYFLVLGIVVLATMGVPSGGAALLVPTMAAVLVGTGCGAWAAPRLSPVAAERLTLGLAAIGGLVLVLARS